jgi:1-acyl-sn-glycerol-3-phosphate acyltransferase
MTVQALAALEPRSSPLTQAATLAILSVLKNIPGRRVHFVAEGADDLPRRPAIIVANHTHKLDWVILRWMGLAQDRPQCNWVKPRTYEEGWGLFLDRTANVPVVSRGYLLAADFRALHDRPPTEAEYRAMRDHLDTGVPLPDEPDFAAVAHRPRQILGRRFDPEHETWRACIDDLFAEMMARTLEHTRSLCDRGCDLQIMPQGVTSPRLTKGRPGALQAALALGLPLVPAGVNGFLRAWGDRGRMVPAHGGTITVRYGKPWFPKPIPGLEPFHPASERAHADALEAGTRDAMERIADLLDPEHGWAGEGDHTDLVGVDRFV